MATTNSHDSLGIVYACFGILVPFLRGSERAFAFIQNVSRYLLTTAFVIRVLTFLSASLDMSLCFGDLIIRYPIEIVTFGDDPGIFVNFFESSVLEVPPS